MKKIMTSIKTLAILLIAGAALTACTDDINIIDEQPVDPATQKYTMTVKASKDGDVATKALSLDGTTLNVTWTAGEEVLVYQNGSKIGTLTAAASSTASTTLSGTLDSAPNASQALTFYFHTAANPSYSGQDGTLTKIASTYDFCAPATVASGSFTVDDVNNTVSVPAGISFGANKQAIVKFTFVDKDNTTTRLSPSALIVSVDLSAAYKAALQSSNEGLYNAIAAKLPYENSLTIPDATYTENGEGVIYLAIPDKIEAMLEEHSEFALLETIIKNGIEIALTATVGSNTYTLTKSGFPFENGKYYAITAKMTKLPPATGHALSESVVGDIVGSNGLAYAVEDKDNLPAGVTIVAMVAYKNGLKGLAVQLNSNPPYKTWDEATSYVTGLPAVPGCTWFLASNDDWLNMFLACRIDGDASSKPSSWDPVEGTDILRIEGFKEKIKATGIAWISRGVDSGCWSSTDAGAGRNNAWSVVIDLDYSPANAFFLGDSKAYKEPVRGCLYF